MSDFPVSEDKEQRRFNYATATRALGLDRPLAFMSPAERMRLYQEAVQPMMQQLICLYARIQRPTIIKRGNDGLLEIKPAELPSALGELERQLRASIEQTRAQILGGTEC